MKKTIVFTGGGTAGHVTPNLALMSLLKEEGIHCEYIGSAHSIEQSLVTDAGFIFHSVASGKLRRYFSLKNFLDPFKILLGIVQSLCLLIKIKPHLVFSKGGFVSVPVVFAAWLYRIPVVAHESDLSAGLANRLTFPFVKKICVTFEAGKQQFSDLDKVIVTGTPIRASLFSGDAARGRQLCGFSEDKPILLFIGGSQGALRINEALRAALPILLKNYQIIHICGADKVDNSLTSIQGYQQFGYVKEALPDLFAAATLVISRSGANSLYELLALRKLHLLIPLSKRISRGDQIDNANYFQKMGVSVVLDDDTLDKTILINAIESILSQKMDYQKKIDQLSIESGSEKVIEVIKTFL